MRLNMRIFSFLSEKFSGLNKPFKELKYSGSTYNMLFTPESNVSILAVMENLSSWNN